MKPLFKILATLSIVFMFTGCASYMACHPRDGSRRLGYIEAWKKEPAKMTMATAIDAGSIFIIYKAEKFIFEDDSSHYPERSDYVYVY